MASNEEATEHTHLLSAIAERNGRGSVIRPPNGHGSDGESIISSQISKEELALGGTAVGERLPYNDYTTIDWLHDLVRNFRPLLLFSSG